MSNLSDIEMDMLSCMSEIDDELYFELQKMEFHEYMRESINKLINIDNEFYDNEEEIGS